MRLENTIRKHAKLQGIFGDTRESGLTDCGSSLNFGAFDLWELPENFKPQWLEFWFSCGSECFGVRIFFFKQLCDDTAALLQGEGQLKVEHKFLFSLKT